jgi:hypothetical protein
MSDLPRLRRAKTRTRCGALVISPLHLIGLLSALQAYHGVDGATVEVFVNWPYGAADTISEITAVIREMARPFPEVIAITPISNESVTKIYADHPTLTGRGRRFREDFATSVFEEVYYPHDVAGEIYRLLAAGHPAARRICIGENLGHVFERDVFFSFLPKPAVGSASFLERTRSMVGRRLRAAKRLMTVAGPDAMHDYPPDEAALLLPIDQSGKMLRHLPFIVPDRQIALDVVEAAADSCRDLGAYCRDLIAARAPADRCYTLLVQNYADGNFIAFDREIQMWAEVVRKFCAPGALVFVKGHPGENVSRCEPLTAVLGSGFRVVPLEARFRRYPIELWRILVANSTIISASNPALSLKYLYGVDVIQPFSPEFIRQWFPAEFCPLFENGLSLFTGPLSRYADWDGKSVLWAGSLRESAQ